MPKGHDHTSEYSYNEIKNYKQCRTCRHFFDNEIETRFECEKDVKTDDCYEEREY